MVWRTCCTCRPTVPTTGPTVADGDFRYWRGHGHGAGVWCKTVSAIATPKLPEEVRRQGITTKKQSTQIVQFITLSSEKRSVTMPSILNNYATLRIRDELARINGIGEVTIFGVGDYAMRIWLDPRLLKARQHYDG